MCNCFLDPIGLGTFSTFSVVMSITQTVTKSTPAKLRQTNEDSTISNTKLVTLLRIITILLIYIAYCNADAIQYVIDLTWEWLRHQFWYQTVYNETFSVQVWTYLPLFAHRLMHNYKLAEKYKITDTSAVYLKTSVVMQLREAFEYSLPLVILDTFHVKSYAGVEPQVLDEKRLHLFQTTRALPVAAPLLGDVVRHLVIALVVYDACFFLQHFIFHKNATLYRLFHKKHHTHESLNVKITNKLHMVERIALVLSANAGLKIQGAHPLTRTFFIMLFVPILLDNHSGYDFPWSYDKILPAGLIAGPRRHFLHHEYGNRYYQPVFTYIDGILEWKRKRNHDANLRRSE
uniref:Cholesterol 25-hydroxylase-like n=1 Tax=Phallusia mammillata TaxID=59560 RepID=A0A6F9D908_9ASCI|nr:cholesterol 25-hydroxylase-like [Phallusia mammillata]